MLLRHIFEFARLPKVRILIVEDEALIAESIRLWLVQMGYDVVGVTDAGEEGVHLSEELRPDLVLMDGSLQGSMDGFEAAGLIEQRCGCPILYVTSNPQGETMRHLLRKPFTVVKLAAAVSAALSSP